MAIFEIYDTNEKNITSYPLLSYSLKIEENRLTLTLFSEHQNFTYYFFIDETWKEMKLIIEHMLRLLRRAFSDNVVLELDEYSELNYVSIGLVNDESFKKFTGYKIIL